MKKTVKPQRKILAVIMAIVMVLLTGITAFAEPFDDEETFVSGDFEYYLYEDGAVSIEGYTGNAEILEIPSTLDGYEVTYIGWYAFSECNSIKSVTIPDTVTEIGMAAFGGCTNLTSIFIPDSVTDIGLGAFSGCSSLTSINIPANVLNIDVYAFDECTSLTSITVDSNNKNYSSQDGVLFNKDKTELIQYPAGKTDTSYTIPNGVASVIGTAFAWCESLVSVTIPDSVTSIGSDVFYETGYYNDASNWTDGVLYIDQWLIEANEDVPTNYAIKAGTKHIADYAFFALTKKIKSITIPDGVASIGDFAFAGCGNLASVTIPDSVTSIGYYAFGSTALYNDASNWTDGVLYIGDFLIVANREIVSGEYTIKEGTKVIASCAFESCHELTGVIIPDSVVTIGISSFAWNDQLTNVKIGNGVKIIDEGAFAWCYNLPSVTVPKSAELIGDFAFYDCYELSDIYIYNKNCVINDTSLVIRYEGYEPVNGWTIPETTVIHGYEGSTAEDYAKEYDREFAVIERAIGDVNGDGKITTVDAKWILQKIAGTKDFSAAQEVDADLNGDGKVSTVDAKWVLQIIAGIRDSETLELIKK